MHYYQFNIGDYASHTRHLSPMEDIAYRRMLDWYYLHERTLPPDPAEVARLISMNDRSTDVERVLQEFFEKCDYGWRNKRADEEIDAFKAKKEQASEAGKASGKSRKQGKRNGRSTDVERTFNGRSTDVERNINHKTGTSNQVEEEMSTSPAASPRASDKSPPLPATSPPEGRTPNAPAQPPKPAVAPPSRPPDPIWDAVCELGNVPVATMARSELSAIGAIVKDLKEKGATTRDDITARAARWNAIFPGATFTIHALAKHYRALDPEAAKSAGALAAHGPAGNRFAPRADPTRIQPPPGKYAGLGKRAPAAPTNPPGHPTGSDEDPAADAG